MDIGNRYATCAQNIRPGVAACQRRPVRQRLTPGGHAGRAKEPLSEANEELRLAADVANDHAANPPERDPDTHGPWNAWAMRCRAPVGQGYGNNRQVRDAHLPVVLVTTKSA